MVATPSAESATPRLAQPVLRVATWNVLWSGLDARLDAITHQLLAIEPDVVLLQEITAGVPSTLGERVGLHAIEYSSEGHRFGVAVLSKTPPGSTIAHDLLDPFTGEPWPLLIAALAMEDANLNVASVHLTATPMAALGAFRDDSPYDDTVNARMNQLNRTAELLSQSPGTTILAGDFNMIPDSPEYKRALELGFDDVWRQRARLGGRATIVEDNTLLKETHEDYLARLAPSRHTPVGRFDYCLDYQFVVGGPLTARAARTFSRPADGNDWASDHLGLVVDYEIPVP